MIQFKCGMYLSGGESTEVECSVLERQCEGGEGVGVRGQVTGTVTEEERQMIELLDCVQWRSYMIYMSKVKNETEIVSVAA